MPWMPEELAVLRKDSVRHLFSLGKISDLERNQDPKKGLFTCDLCTRAEECEWVYHHDNLKDHCLLDEIGSSSSDEDE